MTSIAILVEGATEKALFPSIRDLLRKRLDGNMPKLIPSPCDGRLPTGEKLRRRVRHLLEDGNDAVIALTDVYTGSREFADAADAKRKMQQWVGRGQDLTVAAEACAELKAFLNTILRCSGGPVL
jgi:hypothetical protein